IQRMDVEIFAPARSIDPDYSDTLIKAVDMGIEIIPVQAEVSPRGIVLKDVLSYELGGPGADI
ncbi:MAG: DNA/RNA nuclease SfsA, partial [Marinilabilia sp.]